MNMKTRAKVRAKARTLANIGISGVEDSRDRDNRVNFDWRTGLEQWEVDIISEHGLIRVVREPGIWVSERKWLAGALLESEYIMKLKRGTLQQQKEAICRQLNCWRKCREYLGRQCNQRGGKKIPYIEAPRIKISVESVEGVAGK